MHKHALNLVSRVNGPGRAMRRRVVARSTRHKPSVWVVSHGYPTRMACGGRGGAGRVKGTRDSLESSSAPIAHSPLPGPELKIGPRIVCRSEANVRIQATHLNWRPMTEVETSL